MVGNRFRFRFRFRHNFQYNSPTIQLNNLKVPILGHCGRENIRARPGQANKISFFSTLMLSVEMYNCAAFSLTCAYLFSARDVSWFLCLLLDMFSGVDGEGYSKVGD